MIQRPVTRNQARQVGDTNNIFCGHEHIKTWHLGAHESRTLAGLHVEELKHLQSGVITHARAQRHSHYPICPTLVTKRYTPPI